MQFQSAARHIEMYCSDTPNSFYDVRVWMLGGRGQGDDMGNLQFLASLALAAAMAFGTLPAVGQTADAVGVAQRVVNDVSGAGIAGDRRLGTSDSVFRGERITAEVDSRGEIELIDGAHILVDENSVITLDNFVIADNTFASGTIRLTKGALRLITGHTKGVIKIDTPLANIGIRGSIVDVYVNPESTFVVNLAGVLRVCTTTGRCQTMDRACDIVEITPGEGIEERPFLHSRGRSRAEEAAAFHLSERQLRYGSRWRAPMFACSQRAAMQLREGIEAVDPGDPGESSEPSQPDSPPDREPSQPDTPDDGCGGCETNI
jgi:FecR protein